MDLRLLGCICCGGKITMKTSTLMLLLLFGVPFFLLSNPIDTTPNLKFSELVFDNSNNWTIEITSRFKMSFDSVVFISSGGRSKLNVSYHANQYIAIITSDSLATPLLLNRAGDKIVINTYSSIQSVSKIIILRSDSIIYGDYPGASVGAPVSGFSIMRIFPGFSEINNPIDCLTKFPTLGIANDTLRLSGTLKGQIYDSMNRIISGLKVLSGVSAYSFVLETPLTIDSTGAYSTQIFPTIFSPTKLFVMVYGEYWDAVAIEPFELKNIRPDTVVIQDIHLKDDRFVITSVNNELPPINDELTIMNYPNPFNLSTTFFIKIPLNLRKKAIDISIFNVTGQLVRSISIKESQSVSWDGRDSHGNIMPSGAYFYRLNINKQSMKSGSMILLK
jgi:hypothetical protein